MTESMATAVQLNIDGQILTFNTLSDFEFCLDARTEVPARKVAELLNQPLETLRNEAKSIRRVEQRFMQVLTEALDDAATLTRSMKSLDRQLFSQDYRWRSIVVALDYAAVDRNDFRRAVMVRYVQYLRSRQQALRHAYQEYKRRKKLSSAALPEPAIEVEPEAEPKVAPPFKETAIFEVGELRSSEGARNPETLPRGQPVAIRMPDKPIEVLLSDHRFELLRGEPYLFRDALGSEYSLRRGKNTIGRDTHNDIVVNPGFRDVSRRHLIVETLGDDRVQITDLSSHGTSIGVPALAPTG
jgi:hypothetical protein